MNTLTTTTKQQKHSRNTMDVQACRTYDFSTLRKPGHLRHVQKNANERIQQIHHITATQLFQDKNVHPNNKLQRISSSTPALPPHETTHCRVQQPTEQESSTQIFRTYTPCARRTYMPHERYFDQSYWDRSHSREEMSFSKEGMTRGCERARTVSLGAADSCYESVARNITKQNRSEYYEDMYKKVQSKLKKHIRREEVFSQEEIQKACYQIRKQAKDIVLSDGWQNDEDCTDGLDAEVLQAAYLLRNSHRKDLFTSEESLMESLLSENLVSTFSEEYLKTPNATAISPEGYDSSKNGGVPSIPVRPSQHYLSSDEGTPTDLSAPSSGRSTPSFRRRPKRPDIKLSEMNKPYKDYIEILRAESLSSLQSDQDDDSVKSNRNSYLEISEEMIAKAFLSSQLQDEINDDVHEFERTIEAPSQDYEESLWHTIEKICDERPSSPTAEFLFPLLLSKTDGAGALHQKLSPLLHKLKSLEHQVEDVSSLQVRIAVLQEEKRQLSILLQNKRQSEVVTKEKREIGVQKSLEIVTEIAHKQTTTDNPTHTSVAVGGNVIAEIVFKDTKTQCEVSSNHVSCQYQSAQTADNTTQTVQKATSDTAVGDNRPAEILFSSIGTQQVTQTNNFETQTESILSKSVGNMVGTVTRHLVETGVGDDVCERFHACQDTQTYTTEICDKFVQANVTNKDKCIETDRRYYADVDVQVTADTAEFCCGNNIAVVTTVDKSTSFALERVNASVNTEQNAVCHQGIQCIVNKPSVSVGVGEGNVFEVFCDRCSNISLVDKCCGEYIEKDLPCCTDDKLCECVKPQTISISVSDHTIHDTFCDHCDNLVTKTVAVSEHSIADLLCDKCENIQTSDMAIGEGCVDDVVCDLCENKPLLVDVYTSVDVCTTKSVGVGEGNVNDLDCSECAKGEDNVFNFDLNFTSSQHPVLCHYCGNKVDLNDSVLDESLQAMRDSMQSISSGMKRTEARKDLNLELEDYATQYQSKENVMMTPVSDEAIPISEDEEEEVASHDDVIQACKMLHNHFSGEKPLKQQQMIKYMAVIQSLWFKTVKRRRANASVVKSYIDLFQQRIPELLETIINLSDEETNTALHYALTYKNLGVVSILLDSNECCVDLVNQAGYSPVMLAALTGFERKNDKYIMQRLLRLGNINKESSDTGQTPLMLAVSRGNIGMVELLLDAGCDVNAVDDEGSTALMGACEHGNINLVKMLLANPDCNATIEDNEGSTALSIAMDSRRKDLALLIYGSLNFDARGRIKLSPSKQSLLGLGRRSPSPVIGRR